MHLSAAPDVLYSLGYLTGYLTITLSCLLKSVYFLIHYPKYVPPDSTSTKYLCARKDTCPLTRVAVPIPHLFATKKAMSNKSPSRENPMVGTASLPSKLWPRLRSSWGDTSRNRQMAINPNRLLEGVTGADTSQPFFDGSSKEPSDHLIELDDSSMERLPDVRVYFWSIGRTLLNDTDPHAAVLPCARWLPRTSSRGRHGILSS
jgi:hypothetical protein